MKPLQRLGRACSDVIGVRLNSLGTTIYPGEVTRLRGDPKREQWLEDTSSLESLAHREHQPCGRDCRRQNGDCRGKSEGIQFFDVDVFNDLLGYWDIVMLADILP